MFHRTESLAIPLWALFLFIVAYLGLGLGSYGLLDNNEGLYAQIGREMAQGSSLVIPHVLGVPYMEKPPLLYYLEAAAFSLLGINEFAARLVPLLASLFTLLSVARFCNRMGKPQTGRLAVLFLSSSLGYILMARVVMFDMLFTAFLTTSFLNFFLAWKENNKALLRFAMASLALAVLTKGILALALFGLVLLTYFLIAEQRQLGKAVLFALDPVGLLIFAAIATPWHVLASLEHPRFAWFYFINEHVLRFLGQRIPHDYYGGSYYYYLPRLLVFFFPWAAYLTVFLFRSSGRPDVERRASLFMHCAWIVPLLFFSISSAKANYYMVAALPCLALALAWHLEALLNDEQNKPLFIPSLLLLGVTLLVAGLWWHKSAGQFSIPNIREPQALWLAGLVFLAISLFSVAQLFRKQINTVLLSTALLIAPLQFAFLHSAPQFEALFSAKPLASALKQRCPACTVMIYRDFENISSLAFYLESPPVVIDSASNDLWFAWHENNQEPAFAASDTLKDNYDGALAIVVLRERLEEFQQSPLSRFTKAAFSLGRAHVYLANTP